MPFWPCQYTGGVFETGLIFSPRAETSHTGPTFSVTSMRPSGRNAIRHGNSNVLTVVMVKGRLASGFVSPTLTWAQPVTEARPTNNAIFAKRIVMSLSYLTEIRACRLER